MKNQKIQPLNLRAQGLYFAAQIKHSWGVSYSAWEPATPESHVNPRILDGALYGRVDMRKAEAGFASPESVDMCYRVIEAAFPVTEALPRISGQIVCRAA
jgi:hypothetical protein